LGGVHLHVVDLGPLIRHARRKDLVADPLHLFDSLPARHAGFSGPENSGGGIHVVAAYVDRPANLADTHDRAERHHLTTDVSDLEELDLIGVVAERTIGLHDHLPAPAKPVEVVDVKRAQVNLQGVEDVFRIYSHRLALIAVDVGIKLRHVGSENTDQTFD